MVHVTVARSGTNFITLNVPEQYINYLVVGGVLNTVMTAQHVSNPSGGFYAVLGGLPAATTYTITPNAQHSITASTLGNVYNAPTFSRVSTPLDDPTPSFNVTIAGVTTANGINTFGVSGTVANAGTNSWVFTANPLPVGTNYQLRAQGLFSEFTVPNSTTFTQVTTGNTGTTTFDVLRSQPVISSSVTTAGRTATFSWSLGTTGVTGNITVAYWAGTGSSGSTTVFTSSYANTASGASIGVTNAGTYSYDIFVSFGTGTNTHSTGTFVIGPRPITSTTASVAGPTITASWTFGEGGLTNTTFRYWRGDTGPTVTNTFGPTITSTTFGVTQTGTYNYTVFSGASGATTAGTGSFDVTNQRVTGVTSTVAGTTVSLFWALTPGISSSIALSFERQGGGPTGATLLPAGTTSTVISSLGQAGTYNYTFMTDAGTTGTFDIAPQPVTSSTATVGGDVVIFDWTLGAGGTAPVTVSYLISGGFSATVELPAGTTTLTEQLSVPGVYLYDIFVGDGTTTHATGTFTASSQIVFGDTVTVTGATVLAEWQLGTGISGTVNFDYSLQGSGVTTALDLPAGSTSTEFEVTAAGTYDYTISVLDGSGGSAIGSFIVAPQSVSNLTATVAGSTVTFSWSLGDGPPSDITLRYVLEGVTTTLTLPPNTTTTDVDVGAFGDYTAEVFAGDGSAGSATTSFTVLPQPITSSSTSVAGSTVTFSWTLGDGGTGPITLEYWPTSFVGVTQTAILPAGTLGFVDTVPQAGDYSYDVFVGDGTNTHGLGNFTVAPRDVINPVANVVVDTVTLSWDFGAGGTAPVFVEYTFNGVTTVLGPFPFDTTSTQITLTETGTYSFDIYTGDGTGAHATGTFDILPQPVTGSTAVTSGLNDVTFTWTLGAGISGPVTLSYWLTDLSGDTTTVVLPEGTLTYSTSIVPVGSYSYDIYVGDGSGTHSNGSFLISYPPAVTNAAATFDIPSQTVTLTWDLGVGDPDPITVNYWDVETGVTQTVALPANTTTVDIYIDTPSDYAFDIFAGDGSNTHGAGTFTAVPQSVASSSATVTGATVTFSWALGGTNTQPVTVQYGVTTQVVGASDTALIVEVTESGTHAYDIFVGDGSGTHSTGSFTVVPQPVTSSSASVVGTTVTLTWTLGSGGIDPVHVEYVPVNTGVTTTIDLPALTTTTTFGVTVGGDYNYDIYVGDGSGVHSVGTFDVPFISVTNPQVVSSDFVTFDMSWTLGSVGAADTITVEYTGGSTTLPFGTEQLQVTLPQRIGFGETFSFSVWVGDRPDTPVTASITMPVVGSITAVTVGGVTGTTLAMSFDVTDHVETIIVEGLGEPQTWIVNVSTTVNVPGPGSYEVTATPISEFGQTGTPFDVGTVEIPANVSDVVLTGRTLTWTLSEGPVDSVLVTVDNETLNIGPTTTLFIPTENLSPVGVTITVQAEAQGRVGTSASTFGVPSDNVLTVVTFGAHYAIIQATGTFIPDSPQFLVNGVTTTADVRQDQQYGFLNLTPSTGYTIEGANFVTIQSATFITLASDVQSIVDLQVVPSTGKETSRLVTFNYNNVGVSAEHTFLDLNGNVVEVSDANDHTFIDLIPGDYTLSAYTTAVIDVLGTTFVGHGITATVQFTVDPTPEDILDSSVFIRGNTVTLSWTVGETGDDQPIFVQYRRTDVEGDTVTEQLPPDTQTLVLDLDDGTYAYDIFAGDGSGLHSTGTFVVGPVVADITAIDVSGVEGLVSGHVVLSSMIWDVVVINVEGVTTFEITPPDTDFTVQLPSPDTYNLVATVSSTIYGDGTPLTIDIFYPPEITGVTSMEGLLSWNVEAGPYDQTRIIVGDTIISVEAGTTQTQLPLLPVGGNTVTLNTIKETTFIGATAETVIFVPGVTGLTGTLDNTVVNLVWEIVGGTAFNTNVTWTGPTSGTTNVGQGTSVSIDLVEVGDYTIDVTPVFGHGMSIMVSVEGLQPVSGSTVTVAGTAVTFSWTLGLGRSGLVTLTYTLGDTTTTNVYPESTTSAVEDVPIEGDYTYDIFVGGGTGVHSGGSFTVLPQSVENVSVAVTRDDVTVSWSLGPGAVGEVTFAYWNAEAGNTVTVTLAPQTTEIVLPDLEAGSYTFEVFVGSGRNTHGTDTFMVSPTARVVSISVSGVTGLLSGNVTIDEGLFDFLTLTVEGVTTVELSEPGDFDPLPLLPEPGTFVLTVNAVSEEHGQGMGLSTTVYYPADITSAIVSGSFIDWEVGEGPFDQTIIVVSGSTFTVPSDVTEFTLPEGVTGDIELRTSMVDSFLGAAVVPVQAATKIANLTVDVSNFRAMLTWEIVGDPVPLAVAWTGVEEGGTGVGITTSFEKDVIPGPYLFMVGPEGGETAAGATVEVTVGPSGTTVGPTGATGETGQTGTTAQPPSIIPYYATAIIVIIVLVILVLIAISSFALSPLSFLLR